MTELFTQLLAAGLTGLLAWWLMSDWDFGPDDEGEPAPKWVEELKNHERDRAA